MSDYKSTPYSTEDPYELLGATVSVTVEELKVKFRQIAKSGHPDRGGDTDLGLVHHAYLMLIDPVRRAEYDRTKRFSTLASDTTEERYKAIEMINECIAKIAKGHDLNTVNVVIRVTRMLTHIHSRLKECVESANKQVGEYTALMERLQDGTGNLMGIGIATHQLLIKAQEEYKNNVKEFDAAVIALEMVEGVIDPVSEVAI